MEAYSKFDSYGQLVEKFPILFLQINKGLVNAQMDLAGLSISNKVKNQ